MQHPEQTRVVVTVTHDDGASDYFERVSQSFAEYDESGARFTRAHDCGGPGTARRRWAPGRTLTKSRILGFPDRGAPRFLVFSFLPKSEGGGVVPVPPAATLHRHADDRLRCGLGS